MESNWYNTGRFSVERTIKVPNMNYYWYIIASKGNFGVMISERTYNGIPGGDFIIVRLDTLERLISYSTEAEALETLEVM